jgi:group I intron endonuclease
LAFRENRGKSGIYRWINKETGKSYVGSSANLSKRFNLYFNYNHIAETKRNMRIDRALKKGNFHIK